MVGMERDIRQGRQSSIVSWGSTFLNQAGFSSQSDSKLVAGGLGKFFLSLSAEWKECYHLTRMDD